MSIMSRFADFIRRLASGEGRDTYVSVPTDSLSGGIGTQQQFLSWLNAFRRANGRSVDVILGLSMANVSRENSLAQSVQGRVAHISPLGDATHQNAGYGPLREVARMWMERADHRVHLLSPEITSVGLAEVGGYWTYSAR